MTKNRLSLTFVNVGYGEAMLLECPDPQRPEKDFLMVIDGGSSEAEEFPADRPERIPLIEELRRRGTDHIDVMVSTHIHEDHVCGLLSAAREIPVGELWQTLPSDLAENLPKLPGFDVTDISRRKFCKALSDWKELVTSVKSGGGSILSLSEGSLLSPAPGLTVRVLAPGAERIKRLALDMTELYASSEQDDFIERLTKLDTEMNNFSLILRAEYGGVSMLLPGDTNMDGYDGIDEELLKADIFKVGHHGQKDGIDEKHFRMISPGLTICCASSDRRYDSADPRLIRMIRENGSELRFSDCPKLPEDMGSIPPHRLLRITVGGEMPIEASYIL